MQIRILHHGQELHDVYVHSSVVNTESYSAEKQILLNYNAMLLFLNLLRKSPNFQRLFVDHHKTQNVVVVFNDPMVALLDYKS